MAYIDIGGGSGGSSSGGLIPFAPVLLVAVNPVTPSGTRTIDGRSTGTLERVLLTAQTNPIQNGIWLTDGALSWERPPDLPAGANAAFAFSFVQEGDVYANTGWANSSVPTSVVGTDPQQWVQVIAPGQLIANNGLTLTGSTLDVTPDVDGSLVATLHNLKVGVLATDAQHGMRGGGALHEDATDLFAGFMSAADKTKLDALPSGGGVSPSRTLTAGDGLTGGGDLSADRTFAVLPHADGSIVATPAGTQVGVLATDGQHGPRGGGTQHSLVTIGEAGFMDPADFTKLATVAAGATNTPLSSSLPSSEFAGIPASIGLSPTAARSDHVHAAPAGPPVSVDKSPNSEGTVGQFARADHKHDVTTAAPLTVGTANAEGAATSLARSDHVHAHGDQTAETLHALATAGANGFMASADKQKIDTVASGAAPAMLAWGNSAVSGTTSTRYLSPYYGTVLAPTSPTQFRLSRSGTVRHMRVRHNQPLGNGLDIVYTLRVNGVATPLAVTLASTGSDGSNLIASVPIAAGDLVDIEITKAASIATSPNEIVLTAEFAN